MQRSHQNNDESNGELFEMIRIGSTLTPSSMSSSSPSPSTSNSDYKEVNEISKLSDEQLSTPTKLTRLPLVIFSFPLPTNNTLRVSYSMQREILTDTLFSHRWFTKGYVLKTLEKGVLYPVVHLIHLPDEYIENVTLLDELSLGKDFILHQSLYEELSQITLPVIAQPVHPSARSDRAYIILGFKTLDQTYNDIFEDNWKDWSGARSIYLNLSTDLGLESISFYRRIGTRDFDAFVYLLISVCTNVTSGNRMCLLDFVHRMRCRMVGYCTVYSPCSEPKETLSQTSTFSDSNSLTAIDI